MNNLLKLDTYSFDEKCVYCGNKLVLEKYFFYGWRYLYECRCTKCQANFLVDMPIFSGIPYPAIYDKDKKKVVNSVADWWKDPLENINLNMVNDNIISYLSISIKRKKIIVFNLLDFVFGHCFMRLERLTYYIDNEKYKEYDFLVIIPSQLRFLIKNFENKISLIETNTSFSKYKYFYTCIDREIKNSIQSYCDVYCEMLKYPQQEFLGLTKLNLPIRKWVNEIDKIVIVYRKDRTVGVTSRSQYIFYKKLILMLGSLDIKIILIGDKDKYWFSNVCDLRVEKMEQNTDDIWNEACSGSITIGVHGSNMLIPSICSSYNIEFVNTDKLYNFGQATAFLENLNHQETIQKYRYVYGNKYLSNIDPKMVYALVKSIVVKMNYVFNAVRHEKFEDIETIRKLYQMANNCKLTYSFYDKISSAIYKIRKFINI